MDREDELCITDPSFLSFLVQPCEDSSSCSSSLVSSWSTLQVCQWLRGLNMDQYVPEFTARDIDGEQLLQLDGGKLKALGVSSSDRNSLKRRIKDVQTAAEKEKKALNKLEKQKEKQRRKEQEQRRT